MRDIFRKIANWSADRLGSPYAFIIGIAFVIAWGLTGPMYHYSDGWQLVMNTVTNILTFIMVFLIQNTQNRDTKAMQLKLDELVRAVAEARNELVAVEDAPDEVISNLKQEYQQIRDEGEVPVLNGQPASEKKPDEGAIPRR